jgi:hypothetical protein
MAPFRVDRNEAVYLAIDRLAKTCRRRSLRSNASSPGSLKYRRAFAEAWLLGPPNGPPGPGQRPLKPGMVPHDWRRAILVHQIAGRLQARQGKALTNFSGMPEALLGEFPSTKVEVETVLPIPLSDSLLRS